MLKKITVLLICAVMMTVCAVVPFADDAPSSVASPSRRSPWDVWYTDAVSYITVTPALARTSGHLTRGMFPVIISRAANEDVSRFTRLYFSDVPAGRWYTTAISWAVEKGLFSITDGEYSPDGELSDEQITAVLVRFNAQFGKGDAELGRYSPYSQIASLTDWARDAADYVIARSGATVGDVQSDDTGSDVVPVRDPASQIIGFFTDPAKVGAAIPANALKLDRVVVTVEAKKAEQLSASVLPENASDRSVKWSVADESVALVTSDGVVLGASEGVTTVTASTADGGCVACCIVTVTPSTQPEDPETGRYVDPDQPMIAVTFDDGPSKYSDRILDVFEKYGGAATFFDQGKNVQRWPEVLERYVKLGCEIGSHTWDHPRLINISESEILDQLTRTNQAFIDVLGYAPKLLRPPYGSRNATVDKIAANMGMSIILWTLDTEDWKLKDADKICKFVEENAYDGAILLVHSTHDFTAEAVERFVPELIAKGYQLVTVGEMAKARGVELEPGSRYGSFKPKKEE